MTQLAKQVGGPLVLGVVFSIGGWATGRTLEDGGKRVFRAIPSRSTPHEIKDKTFEIHTDGEHMGGLNVRAGGLYRVLEVAGDEILIEVIVDDDNPYMVPVEFLTSVSDYLVHDTA